MSSTMPQFKAELPPPYAQTTAVCTSHGGALIAPVVLAFEDAMGHRSRLRDDAYRIKGFSGRKFRQFMNNLVRDVPDPRYLEIGLFEGASFCPAIYGNKVDAVGIDNWTEFGGKPAPLHDNVAKFRNPDSVVKIIERDFRDIDYAALHPRNILFYDGSHQEKDQYDGILLPQPAMTDSYVMIVDDWNWDRVRKGTFDAVKAAGLSIDYQIEVRTSFANELPIIHGQASEWHNGCFIGVVTKKTARA
jgi:hypothetical protein